MITIADLQKYHNPKRQIYQDEHCAYIRPHPELASWFSNFTVTFPKNIISRAYTVIPHGSATLVFSYAQGGLHTRLFGPAIAPQEVGEHAVDCDMLVIVEFQPAGLFALTRVPQKEMTGQLYRFDEVVPGLNKAMAEIIESATSIAELVERLEIQLLNSIRAPYRAPELAEAMELIIGQGGKVSVKELSAAVFYSERHLIRIFDQQLGLNPKGFARLVRMNATIRLMQRPGISLTEICNLGGFYDQSHFIREFQAICGTSPQAYMKNMTDFYNEIAKF